MSLLKFLKELSPEIAQLIPEIPSSIMELHNAIEEVLGNEDQITLNGKEYNLVSTEAMEQLEAIHLKCQEIRRLMYG
jgi:hypothetical protein